ncbi:bifunctional E3 ubiquitin-protein ligase HECTD1-TRIP12-like/Armadillo-like helical/HECT domain/Armadillo-type fold/HECT [Babesia duncani]|uniref:HECT-type E3 ubiquitin transferase n=1 Tax=Babesia duncani TaxID=323732 RepID=A0AAD9PME7_9APIC|nr:bifunctional E3 ubiquitin-protein ligase HECTD1-TRIP12-like/Armadillo-like helical/HECT domain/Armadillo-type fold/HECT [Babesia duncani]
MLMHFLDKPNDKFNPGILTKNEDTARVPRECPLYGILSSLYKGRCLGADEDDGVVGSFPSLMHHRQDFEKQIRVLDPRFSDKLDDSVQMLDPEIAANKMIIAATCINTILDIMPQASRYFHSIALINVLKSKLKDIQYIDLAERVILIFDKLSREIPEVLVTNDVILLMMKYCDFFPINIQLLIYRCIWTIIKAIHTPDVSRSLVSLIPMLTEQLMNENKRIVEKVCGIWRSIFELCIKFTQSNSAMNLILDKICSCRSLDRMFHLVFVHKDTIKRQHLSDLLFIISICSKKCEKLVDYILACDILSQFKEWLLNNQPEYDLHCQLFEVANGLVRNDQEIVRVQYYLNNSEHFSRLVDVFSPIILVKVYNGSLSKASRQQCLSLLTGILQVHVALTHSCNLIYSVPLPIEELVEIATFALYSKNQHELAMGSSLTRQLVALGDASTAMALVRHGVVFALEQGRGMPGAKLQGENLEHGTEMLKELLRLVGGSLQSSERGDSGALGSEGGIVTLVAQTPFQIYRKCSLEKHRFVNTAFIKSLVEHASLGKDAECLYLWRLFSSALELHGQCIGSRDAVISRGQARNGIESRENLEQFLKGSSDILQDSQSLKRFQGIACLPIPLWNKVKINLVFNNEKCQINTLNDSNAVAQDVIPTLVVHTSCLVRISRLEQHLLKYIRRRFIDVGKGNKIVPKRRMADAKLIGRKYTGVVLSMGNFQLSSNASLFEILTRFGQEGGDIWASPQTISYRLLKYGETSPVARLFSGKYSPFQTQVFKKWQGIVGLYIDLVQYCSNTSFNVNLSRVKSSISPHEVRGHLIDDVIYTKVGQACKQALENARTHPPNFILPTNCQEVNNIPVDFAQLGYILERARGILSSGTCETFHSSAYWNQFDKGTNDHVLALMLQPLVVLEYIQQRHQNIGTPYPISQRLTVKLLEHLGNLKRSESHDWVIKLALACPSLFSLDARLVLYDYIAKGPHRFYLKAIQKLRASNCTNLGNATNPDHWNLMQEYICPFAAPFASGSLFRDLETSIEPLRLRASVNRKNILADAATIFQRQVASVEMDCIPRLEISFDGEEGTGSGPTLEFYSLVLESLTSKSDMFESTSGYAFPKPLSKKDLNLLEPSVALAAINGHSNDDTIFSRFILLGQTCASALLDSKRIDARLHPLFLQMVQYPRNNFVYTIHHLSMVDADLANSLSRITPENVAQMELTFEYNGFPLAPDGFLKVNAANLSKFKQAVIRYRLDYGIRQQAWAFRLGYSMFMPPESLGCFTCMELAHVLFANLTNQDAFWTGKHLKSFITPDHGYDHQSPAYNHFITVLSEFKSDERRLFLRFCTGAPILPRRGFAGLEPNMKIVKRCDDEMELPSVMTCTNYLKLPNYKSVYTCRQRLLRAITEGCDSFSLS